MVQGRKDRLSIRARYGQSRSLISEFLTKTIHLPRQARDKHENVGVSQVLGANISHGFNTCTLKFQKWNRFRNECVHLDFCSRHLYSAC
eukprot:COSAG06_NODE_838_length_12005_cov_473.630354_6_plen_89_part_00